jgi:hypothetical protein
MKITRRQLKRLIREEIAASLVLQEALRASGRYDIWKTGKFGDEIDIECPAIEQDGEELFDPIETAPKADVVQSIRSQMEQIAEEHPQIQSIIIRSGASIVPIRRDAIQIFRTNVPEYSELSDDAVATKGEQPGSFNENEVTTGNRALAVTRGKNLARALGYEDDQVRYEFEITKDRLYAQIQMIGCSPEITYDGDSGERRRGRGPSASVVRSSIEELEDYEDTLRRGRRIADARLNSLADDLQDQGIEPTNIEAAVGQGADAQLRYLITGPDVDGNDNSSALISLEAILDDIE